MVFIFLAKKYGNRHYHSKPGVGKTDYFICTKRDSLVVVDNDRLEAM